MTDARRDSEQSPTNKLESADNKSSGQFESDRAALGAALSHLRRAAAASEQLDGEAEIERAEERARAEGDDDRVNYPTLAGSLESSVDNADWQGDLIDREVREAIEIIQEVAGL